MNKEDLLKLIEDDELGILEEKKRAAATNPEDRTSQSFAEINEFVDSNGRLPLKGSDIHERKLAARLEHFKNNKEARVAALSLDVHGLLSDDVKEFNELEDFLEDDELDLLSGDDDSILQLRHVPAGGTRNIDEVARRKVCKDFHKYEPIFEQLDVDMRNNVKQLRPFTDADQLEQGRFFVVGGVTGLIVQMEELKKDTYRSYDGRMHCVFENGTESNMLFRSLVKIMQADSTSRVVIATSIDNMPTNDDEEAGNIYILKSLSTNPDIYALTDLYKIGFSKTSVESRIKNAENDPTYLMAPVEIVSAFQCYNMNPQRLERLLHRFFGNAKLNIDITDKEGNRYTPKEWFIAPLDVVHEVIHRIVDGTIVDYKYLLNEKRIIKRD